MIAKIRQHLRNELEAPADTRRFGTGWLSGVLALISSLAALSIMICILFPQLFTTPELHALYQALPFRLVLHAMLIFAFGMALLGLYLRGSTFVGLTAMALVLITNVLGSFEAQLAVDANSKVFFGLDWFVLNVLFTGALFIPIERLLPRHPGQALFRQEWREDLFYYFISSMMVQVLTFLSLLPSKQILAHTAFADFRAMVGGQPLLLQFIEIMLLTDFVQYWVHRCFHRIPALWKFHSVHHSARTMDWMAGARMHFIEILILRGVTVIPMMTLGYSDTIVHAYILVVYIYSTLIHANLRWSPDAVSSLLVTPRFHHWHHGIEREAIDVNFSIHFPLIDKAFGTFFMPPEGRWPKGYGIHKHPVPLGYMKQFMYPFKRSSQA